jgi:hypothetical protein
MRDLRGQKIAQAVCSSDDLYNLSVQFLVLWCAAKCKLVAHYWRCSRNHRKHNCKWMHFIDRNWILDCGTQERAWALRECFWRLYVLVTQVTSFHCELALILLMQFPKPSSLAACCMQELERQPYCIKLYSTNSAPATGLQLAQTFYNTTLKLRCVLFMNLSSYKATKIFNADISKAFDTALTMYTAVCHFLVCTTGQAC